MFNAQFGSTHEETPSDPEPASQPEQPNPDSSLEQFEPPLKSDPEPFLRRIPNFGQAALFVSFAGLMLILFQIVLIAIGQSPSIQNGVIKVQHPKSQLAALAATYLSTLVAAWLFYPMVWHRDFFDGLRWNWQAARRQAPRLIALGLLLGGLVQFVTYFISSPKNLPIDDFFLTARDAWLLTFFGTIVAPVFEEICFRGFLVPAFAIAYDWLSLSRTPEARARWQTTTSLTPMAYVFAAIVSSIFFSWLHADQVAHAAGVLVVLFCVSIVFTYVRVKTDSVACSAMVHAAYNFFVFFMMILQTGGYRHLERITK